MDIDHSRPKGNASATPSQIRSVSLDAIRLDGDTQARAETSDEHVNDICEAIIAEAEIPPVVLFHGGNGSDYWIGDGHHRVLAHRKAHRKEIAAEIRPGGERAAIMHAVGANAEHHGLRRTNADKRRAVETLLRDHQDGCLPGHHACGSRPEADRCWSLLSDREISRHCSVSAPFVGKIREEISPTPAAASVNGLQIGEVRTVTRGGTTYTQNTTNIGKSTKAPEGGKWASRQPANIQAATAQGHEAQQRRSVDHSVSQETRYAGEPASPIQFHSGPESAAPALRNAARSQTPASSSDSDNGLDLVAKEIANALRQHPAAMAEWMELFRPEAGAIGHLTIGELVAAIDARLGLNSRTISRARIGD